MGCITFHTDGKIQITIVWPWRSSWLCKSLLQIHILLSCLPGPLPSSLTPHHLCASREGQRQNASLSVAQCSGSQTGFWGPPLGPQRLPRQSPEYSCTVFFHCSGEIGLLQKIYLNCTESSLIVVVRGWTWYTFTFTVVRHHLCLRFALVFNWGIPCLQDTYWWECGVSWELPSLSGCGFVPLLALPQHLCYCSA